MGGKKCSFFNNCVFSYLFGSYIKVNNIYSEGENIFSFFFDNFIDSAVKSRIYQLQLLVLKVLVCCTGFAHLELNCLLFIASTRLRPSNLQFEVGRSPHQLPVQFRFQFKILMITFKSLNGLSRRISFSVLMHVSVSSGHFMKRYKFLYKLKKGLITVSTVNNHIVTVRWRDRVRHDDTNIYGKLKLQNLYFQTHNCEIWDDFMGNIIDRDLIRGCLMLHLTFALLSLGWQGNLTLY